MIFEEPLQNLTHRDLERLLGMAESQFLEFKSAPYGRGDDDTHEMLRDICSFANASGGYRVYIATS